MGNTLNTTRGPARELSLLEFLAHGGGLDDRGGDLRAMGACDWHRAAPFRAKLVRDEGGVSLDTATLQAWEAGYFTDGAGRPDVNTLLAAIDRELHGARVWSQDGDKWLQAECESRAAFYGECDDEPAQSIISVTYYETPYVNRKGIPGTTYSAKITRAGIGKPVFHHVYRTAQERDEAVAAFRAREGI